MTTVDQRVVQMVFDNAKFQSAVEKTMATLDNLKSKLNFDKTSDAFNKLEKSAKSMNFDDLASKVDSISNRFSTMGIVGMTAIQNITTSVMNLGTKLLTAIPSQIISGGKKRALNLEQAKFQIEGLGYAWEDVSEDINYGVQDTAYGLDAAAKAAGQLLASNVAVGDSMKTALRGISGVAAMTGREYEDISRIFTTVAGNGRLMGDQLNQLSSSGINAAATLGKYLGKSESQVREMVSKGKIDFATFAAAMDDAFGAHAKEANKTFTGALSNVKAALSRIGADFATPAYTNIRLVLSSLIPVIKGVQAALQPLVTVATKGMEYLSTVITGFLDRFETNTIKDILVGPMGDAARIFELLGKSIWNVLTAIGKVFLPILQAFGETLGGTIVQVIIRICEVLEQFTRDLIMSDRMSENLKKTFRGIFTILSVVLDILSRIVLTIGGALLKIATTVFGFIADILLRITGFLGDVVVSVKEFVDRLLQLEIVQGLISIIVGAFERLWHAVGTAVDFVHELLYVLLDNTFNAIGWVFSHIADAVYYVVKAINDMIRAFIDWLRYIKSLPAVQAALEKIRQTVAFLRDHFGEIAVAVKDNLVRTFKSAFEIISKVANKLKEFLSQYIQLPDLQTIVSGAQQLIVDAFTNSANVFEAFAKILVNVGKRIREVSSGAIASLIDNFIKLKDHIKNGVASLNLLENTTNLLIFLREGFFNFSGGVSGFVSNVIEKLSQLINWMQDKFSKVTLGDILAAGFGASFIALTVSITKTAKVAREAFSAFGNIAKAFSGIGSSIKNLLNSTAGLLKKKAEAAKFEAIASIIKSVALLAAALALLSTMDQQKLMSSAIILGALAGALILLIEVVGKFTKDIDIKEAMKSIGSLISVAASLFILVVAIKLLSTVSVENLIGPLIAIGLLLLEMAAVMRIISKSEKTVAKGTGALLGISLAMITMASALKAFAKISNADLQKSMGVVTALMVLMGLIVALASKVKMDVFLTILGIGIGLRLIVSSIKSLAKLDPAKMYTAVYAISQLMGQLGVLILVTAAAGKHAAKAGKALIGMGVSLTLMAVAIKILAGIDPKDMLMAGTVASSLIWLFMLFTGVTKAAGKNADKAGKALIGLGAGMVAISVAIALLSVIDEDDLMKATIAVDSVIGMFALLIAATGKSRMIQKSITSMTTAIIALSALMAIISLMDPANLLSGALAIDSLMVIFASVILATNKMGDFKGKTLATIGAMVLVVGALASVLYILADKGEAILQAGLALSAVVSTLGILSAVVSILSKINPKDILLGSANLGLISLLLSGIGVLLNYIGSIIDDNVVGNIQKAADAMGALGNAIGSFLGNIVGGFIGGMSSGLAEMGANLSLFMENLQGFISGARTIDEGTKNGIMVLVDMIAAVSEADFKDALTFWHGSGSSILGMTANLVLLGMGLKDFQNELKGVNLDNLEKGVSCAKTVAEMADILPREGGVLGSLLGEPGDIKKFGESLKGFGESLKSYADSVSDLNTEAINRSVEPAKSVIQMANDLPRTGGFVQDIIGEQDMEKFGNSLVAFGKSLVAFGDAVVDVKYDAIEKVMKPTQDLIALGNDIPNMGGVISFFTGRNDFEEFGSKLMVYGTCLKNFADKVTDINGDQLKLAIEYTESLVAIAGAMPASWDIENFEKLGTALSSYASTVAAYSDAVKGKDFDINAIRNATEAFSALSGIWDALPRKETVEEVYGFMGMMGSKTIESEGGDLNTFATNIGNLGTGLKAFSDAVSGDNALDAAAIQTAIPILNSLADLTAALPAMEQFITTTASGAFSETTQSSKVTMDLAEFANQLVTLAENLGVFSETIKGYEYDEAKIAIVLNIAKTMAAVTNALSKAKPNVNLATFGWNISDFAVYLKRAYEEIKDFNDSAPFDRMLDVAKKYAELSSIISGVGGSEYIKWMGWDIWELAKWVGEAKGFISDFTDTSTFDNVISVAQKFSDLSTSISSNGAGGSEYIKWIGWDIWELAKWVGEAKDLISDFSDTSTFDNVISVTKQFNELSASINGNGGSESLKILGENIYSFAQSMADGSSLLSEATDVVKMRMAIIAIEELLRKIKEIDKVISAESEAMKDSASKFLDNFISGIQSNSSKIDEAASQIASLLGTALVKKSEAGMIAFGENIVIAIATGIETGLGRFQSAVNTIEMILTDLTKRIVDAFKNAGVNSMQSMVSGMNSKRSAVSSTAQSIANAAIAAFSSSKFYDAGANAGQGFANGMSSKLSEIERRVAQVAQAAINTTAKVLDEHSPSRIAYQQGAYYTIGLANGVRNLGSKVEDSSKYIAQAAINRTSSILSAVGQTIEEELDFYPTITPVLDTSQLQSGFGSYSNMSFGGGQWASVLSRMSYNSMLAQNNQNGMERLVDNLSNKVDLLQDSIAYMTDSFGNQEFAMYVDGKKLASSIARPMNQQLGSIMRRGGISS